VAIERPDWRLWVVGPCGREQNQNIDEHETKWRRSPNRWQNSRTGLFSGDAWMIAVC
jgi:hypothetical protein